MRAKRNVTRDLIASTRVDEDLYRGSLALTELWKDERGRKREKREKRKERKGREKKRNCGRERKGGKRQEEVLALGTTRPVSKTRRAKPEGKGGRETLLPKIYGATGNTRTLLVTSWCTPRALTVLYIYIIWYKNIALFSSSFIANALSLSCPSFSRLFSLLSSRGRGKKVAWGHVTTTTIMPAPSYSPSRPPPLRRPLYSTYTRRMHFATVYVRASFLVSFVIFDKRELRIRGCDHIRDSYMHTSLTTQDFPYFFF